jgi:hypothetical protein
LKYFQHVISIVEDCNVKHFASAVKNIKLTHGLYSRKDGLETDEKLFNNGLMSYNANSIFSKRSNNLAIILLITAIIFGVSTIGFGAEKEGKESLSQFIEGTYSLIGKRPESNETYYGAVKITERKNGFTIVRCLKGKRLTGSAEIVKVTADKIPNLKYSYKEGKSIYEGRYDIHSDIENYGRLSGPYGKKGNKGKPGWELLYVNGDTSSECN